MKDVTPSNKRMAQIRKDNAVTVTKKTKPNLFSNKYIFIVRNVVGQAILFAGFVGYVADHLPNISQNMALGAAAFVGLMVLFFSHSK